MADKSFSYTSSDTTDWELTPSFKYDVLCFVNILTGDEFYLRYYQKEYDKFKDRITPEVSEALSGLSKKLKIENGTIISAWLCLYFSAVDDETIPEMLMTLEDPKMLKLNFEKSPYYSEKSWELFDSIRDDLKIVLKFLEEVKFNEYWVENIYTKVQGKADEFREEVLQYNIIGNVEDHLGYKLPSNKITVYLLYYSQPHGIKITGTRFLTDVAWPFSILIRTATHEMMHPPFDLKNDSLLTGNIEKLRAEEFFMDKVLNHNPSFGYNSLEGFVEEDCVQALDQIINEKLGIAKDAGIRWKESDDGMHVLAIALYTIMKEDDFSGSDESFRDFLIRNIENGKLLNSNIEKIYNGFY
ncbi:MAG TPA: hypothetical protein PKA90_11360 [Ignavibacteria bacterium]|nr:hypothetical protein [Ignavibacteria bacterium]HMR41016.1 hypothetical protein [Ignavibacteria bacterium]